VKPHFGPHEFGRVVLIEQSVHVKAARYPHVHAFMHTPMRPRTSNSLETQLLGREKRTRHIVDVAKKGQSADLVCILFV
jgi:hypothetical protein